MEKVITGREMRLAMLCSAIFGFCIGGSMLGIYVDVYAFHRGFKAASGCDLGTLEPACIPVYQRMDRENKENLEQRVTRMAGQHLKSINKQEEK